MMGSAVTEVYRDIDEFDQHQVTLTTDYFISNTEVTQSQWEAVMGGGLTGHGLEVSQRLRLLLMDEVQHIQHISSVGRI